MTVILRTATHHLVCAFTSPLIDAFIAGPAHVPPDVVFWGSRVFTFATMTDESVTYNEAFSYALVDGITATRLADDELAKIAELDPK